MNGFSRSSRSKLPGGRRSFPLAIAFLFFLGGMQVSGQQSERIQNVASLHLARDRLLRDSLVAAVASVSKFSLGRIALFGDSLKVASGGSLDSGRLDSLVSFVISSAPRLQRLETAAGRVLRALYEEHASAMASVRDSALLRRAGKDVESQTMAAETFADVADSLSQSYQDTSRSIMADAVVQIEDALKEVLEEAKEYVATLREERAEEVADSLGAEEEVASRLVAGLLFKSRAAYRGRDGGVKERAFTPSLAYHDRSGLYAAVGGMYLKNGEGGWDQKTLTAGYEFEVGGVLGGGASYSHFWFQDSSTLSRSVLSQNITLSLYVSAGTIVLGGTAGLDFGDESELNLSATTTFNVHLTPDESVVSVTLSPGLAVSWGQQNGDLLALRKLKVKGKKSSTLRETSSTVFGVMSYDVSVPCAVEIGIVMIQPSVTYTIPTNVLDGSDSEPYGSINLEVALTVK